MNELTQQENINSNVAVFSPQSLAAIQTFSQVMASGMATVPEHLRGNPSDCMAITMQAMQWQMNPYAVAQKTFVVNGVLGYEAQLVNAVISTRGPLTGRIEYDWFGPWEKLSGNLKSGRATKGKNIVYLAGSWPMKTGSVFVSRQHYAAKVNHAYWNYFWRRPEHVTQRYGPTILASSLPI